MRRKKERKKEADEKESRSSLAACTDRWLKVLEKEEEDQGTNCGSW